MLAKKSANQSLKAARAYLAPGILAARLAARTPEGRSSPSSECLSSGTPAAFMAASMPQPTPLKSFFFGLPEELNALVTALLTSFGCLACARESR